MPFKLTMAFTLLSSPLQGFTDFRFRNAFNKHFGGIDTFYAPYIKLNGKLHIKPAYERDILPENNIVIRYPLFYNQILLTSRSNEFPVI